MKRGGRKTAAALFLLLFPANGHEDTQSDRLLLRA
jgi:hypothetical protein